MIGDWRDTLADAGLVEVVEGDRASTGPSWRELGPVAVRELQQAKAALRSVGPMVASVTDLRIASHLSGLLYRPAVKDAVAWPFSCMAGCGPSEASTRMTDSADAWL